MPWGKNPETGTERTAMHVGTFWKRENSVDSAGGKGILSSAKVSY
jgi:hypothetical protein